MKQQLTIHPYLGINSYRNFLSRRTKYWISRSDSLDTPVSVTMSTFPTGTFKLPAFDNTLGALQISLIISSVWVFRAIIYSGCLDDSDQKKKLTVGR